MSKNIFIKSFVISFVFLFLFVNTSFAVTNLASTTNTTTTSTQLSSSNGVVDFSSIGDIITSFNKNILQNLVVVLSGLALVIFLWGLVRFIYDRSNGDITKIDSDKTAMSYGLGGLFILVSVWGIIKMFQGFLGLSSNNDVNLPRICTNGSCNTLSSGSAPPGIGGTGNNGGFNDPKSGGLLDGTYSSDSVKGWSLPLQIGSKGKDVAELQNFLKKGSYDIGTTGVDGDFETNTDSAVKSFQQQNALAVDGIVGPATRAVILYRYLGATNQNNYQSVVNWPDMQYGSENKYVGQMQTLLNDLGCYKSGANYKADNIFGPDTKTALVNFQNANFLKEDGIVGSSTRAVFMSEDSTGCN